MSKCKCKLLLSVCHLVANCAHLQFNAEQVVLYVKGPTELKHNSSLCLTANTKRTTWSPAAGHKAVRPHISYNVVNMERI